MEPEVAQSSALNLEEGTEVVGLGQATGEDTSGEAQIPEEPEPEGTITIPQGKVVPLGAVQAERGKRKEAETKLAATIAEVEPLKQKAQKYDEAAQYLQQAQPIIEALRARPDLVELAKNPPPKQTAKGPLSDEQAIEHAKALDLYKADGAPDVDRAQSVAKLYAGIAEQKTQQAIAPFQQNAALQASMQNKNYILGLKDGAGNALVDPTALNTVWKDVPPELSSRPEVANLLYLTALGLQTQSGKAPRSAPTAPLHTESLGGGKPGPETLTRTDEAFMRASTMPQKEFVQTRNSYKEGQTNSLE